jgi:hypothetical protein
MLKPPSKSAVKTKPPMKEHPILNHGEKKIQVPTLSAPVGLETPELQKQYPVMNAAADIAIVDHYLEQLKVINYLHGTPAIHPFLKILRDLFGNVGLACCLIQSWHCNQKSPMRSWQMGC